MTRPFAKEFSDWYLPTIEGNVDYLALRGQLTTIDELLLRTSGVENEFVMRSLEHWIRTLSQSEGYGCEPERTQVERRKIAPQRLRSEPFILYERRQAPGSYDRILDICLRSGFSPLALQEAREMQTILSLVASEMGVSILPKSAAGLGIKDVAVRPLAGRWPQSELGVATLCSSADEPRLRKFLTTAVQLQPGSARSDEKK